MATSFSLPHRWQTRLSHSTSQLAISESITIDGLDAAGLRVSGNTSVRVFEIDALATVTLTNLIIADGYAQYGGGIANYGVLTLDRVTVTNNQTWEGDSETGGDGGDAGPGGGIYNEGSLTVINSEIVDNFTGDGGDGDPSLSGFGGLVAMVVASTTKANSRSAIPRSTATKPALMVWTIQEFVRHKIPM